MTERLPNSIEEDCPPCCRCKQPDRPSILGQVSRQLGDEQLGVHRCGTRSVLSYALAVLREQEVKKS